LFPFFYTNHIENVEQKQEEEKEINRGGKEESRRRREGKERGGSIDFQPTKSIKQQKQMGFSENCHQYRKRTYESYDTVNCGQEM